MTLLESIQGRKSRKGVITADRYFRSIEQCFDGGFCPTTIFESASADQWQKSLEAASRKLCYTSDDTSVLTNTVAKGVDGVNNTVMRFEAIVTTTKRDRDLDILETSGAIVDPKSPLLWQHIPLQPIGKLIRVTQHADDCLKALFAIADTPLGRDAAVLAEFGALRISHGFDPRDFEALDDEEGWHFKSFEIFEVSLVSIPSNTDAVITAYSREKLHHPAVKGWAQKMFEARPVQATGVELKTEKSAEPKVHDCQCQKLGDGESTASQPSDSTDRPTVVPFEETKLADEKRAFEYFDAAERVQDWARDGADRMDLNIPEHRERYRRAFAYVHGNGLVFSDYKFLHHDIIDKELHVIPRQVRHLVAKVNGAFGGMAENDDIREEVYGHLSSHMKQWGENPPMFRREARARETKEVLSSARTPKFAGTESSSWESVGKSLAAFVRAWHRHTGASEDVSSVETAPASFKRWAASKSLLGNPAADDLRDLIFFPVVNPSTNKLNRGALQAVLGGRGAQANIPEAALESAQSKARALLKRHFDVEADKRGRVLSSKSEAIVKEAIGDIRVALTDEGLTKPVKTILESAVSRLEALLEMNQETVERQFLAIMAGEKSSVVRDVANDLLRLSETIAAAEDAEQWKQVEAELFS